MALGVLFKEDKAYPVSGSSVVASVVYGLCISELEEVIVNDKKASKKWIGYMDQRLTAVHSLLRV